MHTSMRRRSLAALAVTLSLAVTACGSDSDDTATTDAPADTAAVATEAAPADTAAADTTADTTPADSAAPADTSASGTTDASASEGVTDHSVAIPEQAGPADESLDPVVIGVINMDEGTPSFPDVSAGIDAATALINAELGGIQGRPVEIKHCSVGVDQASNQQCAQDFANDDTLNLVIDGYVFGSGYTLPILEAAGLPTLIQTPLTQPDFNATNAWAYQGGNAGGTAGTAAYAAKFLDAQDIVIIGSDNDTLRAAVQTIEALPSVQGRNISTTYVSETAADITADVQVSGALEADAVLSLVNSAQCLQVAQTLQDVGVTAPVISTATCAVPSTLEANSEAFAGWTVVGSGLPPLLPEGESVELDYYMREVPAVRRRGDCPLVPGPRWVRRHARRPAHRQRCARHVEPRGLGSRPRGLYRSVLRRPGRTVLPRSALPCGLQQRGPRLRARQQGHDDDGPGLLRRPRLTRPEFAGDDTAHPHVGHRAPR